MSVVQFETTVDASEAFNAWEAFKKYKGIVQGDIDEKAELATARDEKKELTNVEKSILGQYMTPSAVADFMASLFTQSCDESFHLLDAGAGQGALTCAFLKRWRSGGFNFSRGRATLFEIDAAMIDLLRTNAGQAKQDLPVDLDIKQCDFIEQATMMALRRERPFTHAILNPPYKKINSSSRHRLLLRSAGIETVNLYTAFVALAVESMASGGQLAAIIPRSFCNGPYYRHFRKFLLSSAAIRRIHLFDSRKDAFKADGVLQENCIIHVEKGAQQGDVLISNSNDSSFCDYNIKVYPFKEIVRPSVKEIFIHIPNDRAEIHTELSGKKNLHDLGIEVSTGPVVDFRLRDYLRDMPETGDVPLLYPGHFNSRMEWPKRGFKKPNAIRCCAETVKWFYPKGFYVAVRRLSSKEEKRRIVAYVVDPECFPETRFLGFENHLNVFHCGKRGLPEGLARGLALYLNSTLIDAEFRRFNGHTQVNATDLRALPFPSYEKLITLGEWSGIFEPLSSIPQDMLDKQVESIMQ